MTPRFGTGSLRQLSDVALVQRPAGSVATRRPSRSSVRPLILNARDARTGFGGPKETASLNTSR